MNRSSFKEHTVAIPNYGSINLTISENIKDHRDYFLMAVRKNNTKRNFLFVSQLLGKHIPIPPSRLFNSCNQLVEQYAEEKQLKKDKDQRFECHNPTLVIGFAETATAMGHAVYDNFSKNCYYVHTTREKVENAAFAFEFEEEHCHATEQLFFLQNEDWIKEAKEVLIVDDEVTTGKTIRNIIEQIEKFYPGKSYSVITFLDWRNNENKGHYAELNKNGLEISFYSFVQGWINNITISNNIVTEKKLTFPENYHAKNNGWNIHSIGIESETLLTARNGINCEQREIINEIVNKIITTLRPSLKGNKRAIIGTGEFMYLPLLCGRQLPGENVFNATTRSPIIPTAKEEYGVKKAIEFICPTDESRHEYLYNANIENCDEVILFFESKQDSNKIASLLSELDTLNYKHKHVVFLKPEQK